MNPHAFPISKAEATHSIAWGILWTLLSCGIYGIYWQYKQMKTLNAWLKREEFSFWFWVLLSLVTCGIYGIYIEYKMGKAIVEIQASRGRLDSDYLPWLSLVLAIFSFNLITNVIQQSEINDLYQV